MILIEPGLCGCGCGARTSLKWKGSKVYRRFVLGHQHPNSRLSWQARFDCHVYPDPNSGCFIFVGKSTREGYGLFRYKGKTMMAHRVAWLLSGLDIPDGLCVLHKCDQASCVNPGHLFIGTRKDNNQDRAKKHRSQKGSGQYPPGVSRQRGRFKAQFCPPLSGRTQGLGRYDTVEQAAAVAKFCKEVAYGLTGLAGPSPSAGLASPPSGPPSALAGGLA